MNTLLGVLQIIRCLLRNELQLKPLGRKASRVVNAYLDAHGIGYRRVEVWLGLAEPQFLSCLVFVANDGTKARLEAEDQVPKLTERFRKALLAVGYPSVAVSEIKVTVHSDEEIHRVGWYHYFK